MAQFPDIEARLIAQEHTTAMLQASVEKLSKDITASFQHLAQYQGATEHELDIRFRHIDARLDRLEAHMATKEDLASLENKFDQRFASLEQRFASLDTKFDSVLQLLTILTRKIVE